MTRKWMLVIADEGRIGPGSNADAVAFDEYDEAMKEMLRRIEENGGGEWNEDFGNGYSECPFVVYEIFQIV